MEVETTWRGMEKHSRYKPLACGKYATVIPSEGVPVSVEKPKKAALR